jgi:carbonic anhydrase
MSTRRAVLFSFVVAFALLGVSISAESPHWDYGTEHGSSAWGRLDPAYATCASGKSQSPVDLPSKAPTMSAEQKAKLGPATVSIGHGAHIADVLNNGHTVQVNYAGADTLTLGGTSFALVQYHFHSPSEHTVDGRHSPMEMHLVHKSAEGKLAVIGVLIEEGPANASFDPVWTKLPKDEGADRKLGKLDVDVDRLLPSERTAYWYEGSLTTPPCSEGVEWFVMTAPIRLSSGQIKAFRDIIRGNNRPTQPLNGRGIVIEPLPYK